MTIVCYTYIHHVQRIHTKRWYTCERCGLELRRKDALDRHMKIHAEFKQFKCKYCDKAYS